MAYLLIVINVLAGLAEGIFIKKYNSKHMYGGFVFTAIVSLFAMVFCLIGDKNGFSVPVELLPYAIGSGLLYCLASILTYFALAYGSFALSMLVLSYSIVFSIGYGVIFLHEPVTPYSAVGFVLLVVSLYLTRKDGLSGKLSFKWLFCILLSVVGNGMYSVVTRMQQIRFDGAYDNECLAIGLGLSAVLLFVFGIFTDGKHMREILRYAAPYAMGAGLINGLRNVIGLLVCTMIPISVSSATTSGMKIVVSFFVSYLMFKETFLKRQIAGVAIGAVALVLLNI